MFVLDNEEFGNFDLVNINEFVAYWRSLYTGKPARIVDAEERIDYLSELNMDHALTEENIVRLLRWKDPKYLTHVILSGPNKGDPNQKVQRVLESLDSLNGFRDGNVSEDDFLEMASQIFPNGHVWTIFLFHICRPVQYPIADQHVFRAFSRHTGTVLGSGQGLKAMWPTYLGYVDYFMCIFHALHENPAQDIVRAMKHVDNALVAFGQFLKKYGNG